MTNSKTILVTGGAGFIGSAVIREIITNTRYSVINVDKLTYAGNLSSLASVVVDPRYHFEKIDICDADKVAKVLSKYQPDVILHLAAETHVDRSIVGSNEFIQSNIIGTYNLLEQSMSYWSKMTAQKKRDFRFHHISTDEVYGDLNANDPPFSKDSKSSVRSVNAFEKVSIETKQSKGDRFTEKTPYAPSSPYSASKASADHLVRAWNRTYNLPTIVTNCSNNYGPFHFPEKLIPLVISNALQGKQIPVYGSGQQIRDWLYVEDHAKALILVATQGRTGQTYNIGGYNEKKNIQVVNAICELLEELAPRKPTGVKNYKELIVYVSDRPGHDEHYAVDASKIARELNWKPKETFETGIRKTVQWYIENPEWCQTL